MKAGDTVIRHVQHYLAGALNEEAGEFFVLAIARAIERGATTHAEAIGVIAHTYLKATEPKTRARRGSAAVAGT